MKIKAAIGSILVVLILLGTVLGFFSPKDIAIHDEVKIEISSSTDDCFYRIAAIYGQSNIALGDVCLIIVASSSTVLLHPTQLTKFNSSGDLYYHHVRFNDVVNPGQLNVGDYFQFNRTLYWGSHFALVDTQETMKYCDVTIDDADAVFVVVVFDQQPANSFSTNTVILVFSFAAAAILIGTALMVRFFKVDEEKRKLIWRLVAAVMGLLIVLFIAALLYTMVM